MTEVTPDAYLYTSDDGAVELILDCNGEQARRLLELGYTECPLYTRPASTEAADAPKQRPWCETCGKDVHEVLCPTCAKWWNDNPPPNDADAATITALRQRVAELESDMEQVARMLDYLSERQEDDLVRLRDNAAAIRNRSNDHEG